MYNKVGMATGPLDDLKPHRRILRTTWVEVHGYEFTLVPSLVVRKKNIPSTQVSARVCRSGGALAQA